MSNIINRKTYIISVNLITLTGAVPSQVTLPLDLTFAADELVVKSLAYSSLAGNADVNDLVQIACNITNDNLICAFPNTLMFSEVHDEHFAINNSFSGGNLTLQFQGTDGLITEIGPVFASSASFRPQRLISAQVPQRTKGTLVLTIEFVKYAK